MPIAKENIPFGGVLAVTRGQRVDAELVKANGWDDLVVGEGTKEARTILAEITGEPVADTEKPTTGRTASATTEKG